MADSDNAAGPVPGLMTRAGLGLVYALAGRDLVKAAPGIGTRAAQAVAYTIAGVKPDTWFGPMQPLQPMAPAGSKGRAFDYLFGWNLQYIPRATEQVSFQTLRSAADRCDLLRLLIETRKDRMAVLDWEVRPKEITKGIRPKGSKYSTQIDEVTALLRSPDKRLQWGQWVREVLDQNLVYDAVSVYRRKMRNGKPFTWELIDGATIKVLLDADGRTPLPPSPAYQQVLKGIPAANFSSWDTGDMLYFPENPRVDRGYGFSRVEQCLRYISLQINRLDSQLGWYEEGNVPEGFMEAPQEMTLSQVSSMQDLWDSIFAGLQAVKQRRKVWWVPHGSTYTAMKEAALKGDIDEWIARVLCFAMSEDPTPFTKQTNRATAESAQMKAEAEGLLPSMLYVRRLVNTLIERDFGYTDIEFAWSLDTEFDPVKKAVIDEKYATRAIKSIDEVRESIGEEPLGGAFSRPMVLTPTGYVAIDANVNPDGSAKEPPEPVVAAAPGAAGAQPAKKDPKKKDNKKDGKGQQGSSTAGGEGATGRSGSGGEKAKKSITRPVLNAHELIKWLDGVHIDGAPKVGMDDMFIHVGECVPAESAPQPSAIYVDGGKRSIEAMPDGRLGLYFEAPEVSARAAEIDLGSAPLPVDVPLWRVCIPLTTGPASLVLTEKRSEPEPVEDDKAAAAGNKKKAAAMDVVEAVVTLEKADAYGGPILLGAETAADIGKATREEVDSAAASAHAAPSPAQARAGNYRHGHVDVQGLDISIENAAGSKRKGVGEDGEPWSVVMPVHYGYIKRTKGADGDHVDVYLGDYPDADRVWIVDQVDADTGEFDEHKCFVGFSSWSECQSAYIAAFSDGRGHERLGHVSSMSMAEFKDWLAEGPRTEPRSMSKSVTVGTGLVNHDLRGARRSRRDNGERLHRLYQRRGEPCESGCKYCANKVNAGRPGFEKVIQWRKY